MNDREMRRYVVDLVRRTIAKHELPERPATAQVAEALQLPPVKFKPLPRYRDGMRTGRQITLNSLVTSPERVEFTHFHEIAHILVEDDGEILSELHEHFYHSSDEEMNYALEELCQLGAAEFVMPSAAFRGALASNGWRVQALESVASGFGCSLIAAGFQFAHQNPDPCTLLVCEWGIPPRSAAGPLLVDRSHQTPCLFVAYTARSEGSYAMRRHVSIPKNHLIHHVWQSGATDAGEDAGFFRNPKEWKIWCEVARLQGRAYAAFYPKGRKWTAEQPALFEL